MAVFGDTELSPTKQLIVAERVQRQLIQQSVILPFSSDYSAFAVKGAESVAIPKAGDFTVNNRASGALATQQVLNYERDVIALDQRATVSWVVDPMDEIESVVAVNEDLIGRATRQHAKYVDDQLIAELEAAGVAIGTASLAVTDDIILEMQADLLSRDARMENLVMVVGPANHADILGINKFTASDVYGRPIIPNGMLGTVYGTTIVMKTDLAEGSYYMYDREALAIAFQRAPQLDSRRAPEYGAGAELFTLDQKFGTQSLFLGQKGVLAAESALIVKDGN